MPIRHTRRRYDALIAPLIVTQLTALSSAAGASYRQKAEEQTAFCQTHFYQADAQRYHGSSPLDPKGLPYAMMWDNGVMLRALVVAAHYDPTTYRPLLDSFGAGLRDYWASRTAIPGFTAYCSGPDGNDKYYDDNAWMVLGFLEAYQETHDPKFLNWAKETQHFVLSGWDDRLGGGIYWHVKHQSKNTCVNAPAAVSALRLYELTGDRDQLDWALKIRKWVNATLQDSDGLYWDNINIDGHIEKTKWTYNTGLMIQANVLLYRLQHQKQDLREAERIADASIAAWQDPKTGAFQNDVSFTHLLCEGLLNLYQADHDRRYLDAVRRHAAYGYRTARDPQGGYWNHWTGNHKPDDRKSLLENASDARLFWLLAPYPDSDALYAQGMNSVRARQDVRAEALFREAANSDTEAVEARYQLWRVLVRHKKTAQAHAVEDELAHLSATPTLRTRLEAVGWRPQADNKAFVLE